MRARTVIPILVVALLVSGCNGRATVSSGDCGGCGSCQTSCGETFTLSLIAGICEGLIEVLFVSCR